MDLDSEYMEVYPSLPPYSSGSVKKGKAMIALFPDHTNLSPTQIRDFKKETAKIEREFKDLGYEPHIWSEMSNGYPRSETFLGQLEKVAKDVPDSESFVMYIRCSQKEGKLLLPNGDGFEMENVFLKFNADKCKNLKCKPKMFFFSSYPYQHTSVGKQHKIHASGEMKGRELCLKKCVFLPATVPLESDMLVVHSYEGRDLTEAVSPKGLFIDTLIRVLKRDFDQANEHKDILELIVDANDELINSCQNTPIPIALSTLNDDYYLKSNNPN